MTSPNHNNASPWPFSLSPRMSRRQRTAPSPSAHAARCGPCAPIPLRTACAPKWQWRPRRRGSKCSILTSCACSISRATLAALCSMQRRVVVRVQLRRVAVAQRRGRGLVCGGAQRLEVNLHILHEGVASPTSCLLRLSRRFSSAGSSDLIGASGGGPLSMAAAAPPSSFTSDSIVEA